MQKHLNDMRSNGETISETKVIEKILRTLIDWFDYVTATIDESKDLSTMAIDELQGFLETHEH